MREITLTSNAKINLTLDVLGRRADGYHELKMIMQSVNLADTITLCRNKTETVTLRSNLPYLPTDARNLCVRTAQRMRQRYGIEEGVSITLHKRIPVAAGLAGGSGNAAATIEGMAALFSLPISAEEKSALALEIGADVPYCLLGKTALAEGIGEILTVLPAMPKTFLVLCKPPVSISTAKIFGALKTRKITEHPDTAGVIAALEKGDIYAISHRCFNVLEGVTTALCPAVADIKQTLLGSGALAAVMSGSGPTVYGLFETEAAATAAAQPLKKQYADVFVCHSC